MGRRLRAKICRRVNEFHLVDKEALLMSSLSSWEVQKESQYFDKKGVRYEEFTPLGKSFLQGTDNLPFPYFKFKIVDYNILSHTHMLTHLRNYKNCPRQCLNWSYRKSVLRDELLAENSEIICLQEVEEENKNEFLEPFRKLGFDALFIPRGNGKPDGCAFLYKTSVFRVTDFSPVHFIRPEVSIMDRPNVGMVVKLELQSHPGHFLVVANTHLLYNQRRVDVKLCQLLMLLAETEQVAYNYTGGSNQYHPVIVTGDLNVKRDSSLIKLLAEGSLDLSNKNAEKHQEELRVPADSLREGLNMSESCQYLDAVEAREKKLVDPRQNKELHKLVEQHRVCPEISIDADVESSSKLSLQYNTPLYSHPNKRPCSGVWKHAFSFLNVYNNPEIKNIKTKKGEERQLAVYDYMFYSSDKKHLLNSSLVKPKLGELRLLSRLRLPSLSEYQSHIRYLPNFACPSDHLPLVASFLLPVQS